MELNIGNHDRARSPITPAKGDPIRALLRNVNSLLTATSDRTEPDLLHLDSLQIQGTGVTWLVLRYMYDRGHLTMEPDDLL